MSFEELGLSHEILNAVKAKNYLAPTPIQEMAIPLVLEGRDVMGCAQTGTGKTAAFALPIIQRLREGVRRGAKSPGTDASGSRESGRRVSGRARPSVDVGR